MRSINIYQRESSTEKYDPVAAGALCHSCPLYGAVVVPPTIVADDELFVLGENPGEKEVQQGRPFVGPSGTMLDGILKEIGIPREKVSISNSILCRCTVPGEKSNKKKYDTKEYLAWLKKENARLRREAKVAKVTFKPVKSPMECCRPRLLRELAAADERAKARGFVNGAVVVPLGNFAVHAVLGKSGIMKQRGSVNVLEKIE